MSSQPSPGSEHLVVVGVDGSPSSRAALAWAVEHARLTGATVEAVIAWEVRANYGGYPVPVPSPAPPNVDWAGLATEVLDHAIADANPDKDVTIRPTVTPGNAGHALLEAAKDADLLVVGHRGHGGLVEALLGSVSQYCVHHATCPVVVVRSPVIA